MTSPVVTVGLDEVAGLLVEKGISAVLVVEAEGSMVSAMDSFQDREPYTKCAALIRNNAITLLMKETSSARWCGSVIRHDPIPVRRRLPDLAVIFSSQGEPPNNMGNAIDLPSYRTTPSPNYQFGERTSCLADPATKSQQPSVAIDPATRDRTGRLSEYSICPGSRWSPQ